jgi:hypothetical protein
MAVVQSISYGVRIDRIVTFNVLKVSVVYNGCVSRVPSESFCWIMQQIVSIWRNESLPLLLVKRSFVCRIHFGSILQLKRPVVEPLRYVCPRPETVRIKCAAPFRDKRNGWSLHVSTGDRYGSPFG